MSMMMEEKRERVRVDSSPCSSVLVEWRTAGEVRPITAIRRSPAFTRAAVWRGEGGRG